MLRRWIPRWVRRGALAPLARAWPKADWLPRPLRAKTRLTNLSLGADAAYANTLTICRQPLRRQLIAPEFAQRLNGHEPERIIRAGYAVAPADDALAGMISADVATVLPDDFLVKVDRASMAHGLEVRPPLLDHELLELAARIPSHYKVRNGQTKWIFKQACRDLVGDSVIERPKHGFDIPVNEWFRGPLRDMFHDGVLQHGARVAELVNQPIAERLFQSHQRGIGQHGAVLWSILMLSRWAEHYL
jgi:asparagine synthase (glutamine-hydrolysing)